MRVGLQADYDLRRARYPKEKETEGDVEPPPAWHPALALIMAHKRNDTLVAAPE